MGCTSTSTSTSTTTVAALLDPNNERDREALMFLGCSISKWSSIWGDRYKVECKDITINIVNVKYCCYKRKKQIRTLYFSVNGQHLYRCNVPVNKSIGLLSGLTDVILGLKDTHVTI